MFHRKLVENLLTKNTQGINNLNSRKKGLIKLINLKSIFLFKNSSKRIRENIIHHTKIHILTKTNIF